MIINKQQYEGINCTSYKEHCDLFTEIYGSIAVNSCQIELAQKVTNNTFIKLSLSAGTYSVDDFSAKIKVAVLQGGQDWEPPQIKDLKLVIPEHYTFMTSNTIFIVLDILEKHLKKTTLIKSTLLAGSHKTSLDTLSPPKLLLLHYKQTNKVKNKLNGHPSSLIACMHVFNYEAVFSPKHLLFLELEIHLPNLDFKVLDENNNEVILRTFYLQLLNKE